MDIEYTLPSEPLELPELGEVSIRGLLMSDRMALLSAADADGGQWVTGVLARCVVDDAGEPLGTRDEWDLYGSKHYDDAMRAYAVARRLLGLDSEEHEKNE